MAGTESIFMSLPPTAPGLNIVINLNLEAEEDKLLQVCLHPREWV